MTRTRSPLAALLFLFMGFGAATSVTAVPPGPGRLDPNVSPSFEAVSLKLDPAETTYSGSVRIDVDVAATTSEFLFDAEDMTIGSLRLAGAKGDIPATFAAREGGVVAVTTKEPLVPGRYTVSIAFTNAFDTRAVGLYRMTKGGKAYAFTQFESADGRRAFPMWDEPAYKIPYQVTLTIPAKLKAVANTLPETTTASPDGWTTIRFHTTKPLPSYLVAVAVGPFEFVEIKGMKVPGRVVTPAGEAALGQIAAQEAPKIVAALERYFDIDYPFDKLDLIAVPEFWAGAMENAGAITYAEPILLIDPADATPSRLERVIYVTAHELAHQWFGDLVTMRWWDDLWLNESFADWMGDRITDELVPRYRHGLTELEKIQNIYNLDARASVGAIRQKVASADQGLADVGLAYDKGNAVLRMIEEWIGPETFRRGVIAYLHAHAWGNATGSDLWSSLSTAAGRDVAASLETFLDQPGFPLIDVHLLAGGKVRLRQQRFLNAGDTAPAEAWKIPVFIRYSDGRSVRTSTFLLAKAEATFELPAKRIAWIFPNADSNGYYRWRLDPARMRDLARHAADGLDARERIAFLGDLSSLLDAGLLHGDDYLQMTTALANDPEPEVVAAVLGQLERVNLALVDDADRPAFARFLRATLHPAMERYGFERRKGEDDGVTMVRPQLIEWLGTEGASPEVRAFAAKAAAAFMKDKSSVDPSIVGAVLRVAAWNGDEALFEAYRKRVETAGTPDDRARFIAAIAGFQSPELRAKALDFALHGGLRPNEMFRIPFGMARTAATHRFLFRWFIDHYDEIASRIPPAFLGFMPEVASGCDAETLAAAKKFFGEKGHRAEGTEKTMAHVEDQVEDCVHLRSREEARVARYLAAAR
jgi:aminopeptidase N